jgi:hypothetical protein
MNTEAVSKNMVPIEDGPPLDFICPLTHEIMVNPVMCIHGYSCEKGAILKYLDAGNTSCPLTDLPLSIRDLATHSSLRAKIMKWQVHAEGEIRLLSDKKAVYDMPNSFLTLMKIENNPVTSTKTKNSKVGAQNTKTENPTYTSSSSEEMRPQVSDKKASDEMPTSSPTQIEVDSNTTTVTKPENAKVSAQDAKLENPMRRSSFTQKMKFAFAKKNMNAALAA